MEGMIRLEQVKDKTPPTMMERLAVRLPWDVYLALFVAIVACGLWWASIGVSGRLMNMVVSLLAWLSVAGMYYGRRYEQRVLLKWHIAIAPLSEAQLEEACCSHLLTPLERAELQRLRKAIPVSLR